MVLFDQLRISDKGDLMYINIHVNEATYFENIFLESITILTADQVSETDPYTVQMENDTPVNCIYHYDFSSEVKRADIVLRPSDMNLSYTKSDFSGPLFFVYVKCAEGVLVGCPPCTLDELTTLGVVFDSALLYQHTMDYTKELADDCTPPSGFIDFILLWNAFKAAIETEHYIPAIRYYNMLFDNGSHDMTANKTKPCGCHG